MGMSAITVRRAGEGDVPAITVIYNQGIEDRVATLETELRTEGERRDWLAARGERHPVFVAERDGRVVAWASLNRFNPRPAYDHVADLSIYVERGERGRGVGRALLPHVIDAAQTIGYHKMVLAAFPTNARGMQLYEAMGFRRVGIYREQGLLDGRWVDVIIMERIFS